jgi:hypothetical protein
MNHQVTSWKDDEKTMQFGPDILFHPIPLKVESLSE